MRSRAERRRALEWVLRGLLVAVLAIALVRSLAPAATTTTVRRADARALRAALAEATRTPGVVGLEVDVDSLPTSADRAWLSALRRAGVDVSWTGRPSALAVGAERAREPSGSARIAIVPGERDGPIALADPAGLLDSVASTGGGATITSASVVGDVRAVRGRFVARAAVPPVRPPRAVLVLGRASWEDKFAAAALQEAGWIVRARQPLAPGVSVSDAGLLPLDTSRYAAVVALDSTAADLAPQVARFVAQGGGLLLAGGAPSIPVFASLTPAGTGGRTAGRLPLDADSVTLASLPVRTLSPVRADAVRLLGTTAAPTVAVRRAGLGRVMTIGYEETWRWRMMGGAGGAAAHRAWWSRAVGMVAPEPEDVPAGADAAPLAALVEALGPPRPHAAPTSPPSRESLAWYLLLLVVATLLAETASRRFRGAS